jgi:hypothetical protein
MWTSAKSTASAGLLAGQLASQLIGCASTAKPVDAPPPVVDAAPPVAAEPAPPPVVDAGPPPSAQVVDGGPPVASAKPSPKGTSPKGTQVKVQYIGMHVGGGPFDDATKKPFETVLAPHHPEAAECWAKHVTKTKPFDVGVDLLIEASGGHPKVSNPRVRFEKGDDDGQFVPCIVGVFESVDFPPLARGKSGVSYSMRFTPTP